jgi:hypothetical protein
MSSRIPFTKTLTRIATLGGKLELTLERPVGWLKALRSHRDTLKREVRLDTNWKWQDYDKTEKTEDNVPNETGQHNPHSDYTTVWTTREFWFDSWQGQGILLPNTSISFEVYPAWVRSGKAIPGQDLRVFIFSPCM